MPNASSADLSVSTSAASLPTSSASVTRRTYHEGDRAGTLTLLLFVRASDLYGAEWLCGCDCGETCVRKERLLSRRSRCGACKRKAAAQREALDAARERLLRRRAWESYRACHQTPFDD